MNIQKNIFVVVNRITVWVFFALCIGLEKHKALYLLFGRCGGVYEVLLCIRRHTYEYVETIRIA